MLLTKRDTFFSEKRLLILPSSLDMAERLFYIKIRRKPKLAVFR